MEDIAYTLHWNKEAEASLKPLLIEGNIPFEERELFLKGGPFAVGGATVVEILQAVSGLGLAGILIAWINAKANRHIHITKTNNTVEYIAKGMSPEEAEKHLQTAKDIAITEIPNGKT
jgi:hypothetical protein